MSRRKQGSRPRHLSSTLHADTEEEALCSRVEDCSSKGEPINRDLLICGQCGSSFLLSQIVTFIEHKTTLCASGKHYLEGSAHNPCSSPGQALASLCSIYQVRAASLTKDTAVHFSEGCLPTVGFRRKDLRDESEPACYTCVICREMFNSAWFLLQHAQNVHGFQICLEAESRKSFTPKNVLPVCQHEETVAQSCGWSSESCMEDTTTHSFRPLEEVMPEGHVQPSVLPGSNAEEHHLCHTNSEHAYLEKHDFEMYNCALSMGVPHLPSKTSQKQTFSTDCSIPANKSLPLKSQASSALLVQMNDPSVMRQTFPFLPRDAVQQEKVKSCEYCGKAFKFASNLVVHRRSHTGEKPYKCSICKHACTQRSKLKRHMKTHRQKIVAMAQDHETVASEGPLETSSEIELKRTEEVQKSDSSTGFLKNVKFPVEKGKVDEEDDSSKDWKNLDLLQHQLEGSGALQHSNPFVLQLTHSDEYRKSLVTFSKQGSATMPLENFSDSETCRNDVPPIGLKDEADGSSHNIDSKTDLPLLPKSISSEKGFMQCVFKHANLENRSEKLGSQLLDVQGDSSPWRSESIECLPGVSPSDNSSDHSFDNGNSQVSSHTDDSSEEVLSSESGIASGNCTPKHNGTDIQSSKRRDTCEFCGKVFRNSSNLTVHRRSHTGERPYHCPLCSYACAQSSKLTRHMKTHIQSGKLPFHCKICNIPFSICSTLEKHMKKHHTEAIFDYFLSGENSAE